MDSICGVFRLGLWFGCLLCVLPIANATTVPVTVPSAHATVKNSSGVSISGNSLRVTGPLQGTFIPGEGPGSRVSLKVKPVVDFSIPRTINAIKPLVRKGFAPALATAGVVWAINQLPGASFDPQTGQPVINVSNTGWVMTGTSSPVYNSSQVNIHCSNLAYSTNRLWHRLEPIGNSRLNCLGEMRQTNGTVISSQLLTFYTYYFEPPRLQPFTDQNYTTLDSKLDMIVNPSWVRDMLLASCSDAPNPESCVDFLKDWQSNIVGPSTVPGGSTTTTSTYVKPDGTVGTKGSTTTNNYKVTYGPTSFTFNKTSTTTYTQDGVETGTDVTEETPAPDEEPTPPEEEQEQSSPCTTDCDGPEYEDLYEPTEDTKEDHIDSYSDRVSDIPIIAAVGGLFDVSVSASSCPTWSYNSTLDIGVASMPIDLNFDYHCLPWFVSLGPWIQTIFLLGCTLAAIRIGIL